MEPMFYIYHFVLGTFFWSFASVIIERTKSEQWWILAWRSQCPKCKHLLGVFDLIPLLSYIFTLWKCSQCKAKISLFYPLLEITMGIMFLAVSYFLVNINLVLLVSIQEIIKLIFLLVISFITVIFIFYDIKYLEIPEGVLFVWNIITLWVVVAQTGLINTNIIPTLPTSLFSGNMETLLAILIWVTAIAWLYLIMFFELRVFIDIWILVWIIALLYLYKSYFGVYLTLIPILSAVIGALWVFLFFYIQYLISWGTWIGEWDFRIWILLWLLLGADYTLIAMFIAYLSGSIIGIIVVILTYFSRIYINKRKGNFLSWFIVPVATGISFIWKKIFKKFRWIIIGASWILTAFIQLHSSSDDSSLMKIKLPFWPFLWIWIFTTLFFHDAILGILHGLWFIF